ncbi:MAG: hypothetical protein NT169_27175 [Chloroflexi bacterium]|nr:hypothetical protein [Chloroflexota bacterium]
MNRSRCCLTPVGLDDGLTQSSPHDGAGFSPEVWRRAWLLPPGIGVLAGGA